MRFVRGTDLKKELEKSGSIPLPESLKILSDTAAALDAAHAAGLVHRDVKPGNILLSSDTTDGRRHVYLTDFGLTKRTTSATGVTTAGHFLGTVDYVAPEQIRGRDVDGRADVYALACVAYALLTGHPPFDHDEDSAQLWAHIIEDPPRLRLERPETPPAVELAIRAGMAKQPDDRPRTCGALVAMMSDPAVEGTRTRRPRAADAGARPAAGAGTPGVSSGVPSRGSGTHTGGSGRKHRVAMGSPNRAKWLAVLGFVCVLALAGLLLPRILSGDNRQTFRNDDVPYTLDVPQSWTVRTREAGDSTVSVMSGADLTALFADEPGAPADAARTAGEPDKVVGLAIYHRPAGLGGQSPTARVGTAEALLPGRDARLADRGQTTLGVVPAQAMEGTMPLSGTVALQVRVFVLETEPVQMLVFFAPSSLFEQRTAVFDEVAGSLRTTK